MMSSAASTPPCRKIVVLVVHGVGEQRRFDQLELIAANFFRALRYNGRQPVMQVHGGDQVPRCSPEHSWRETQLTIRWKPPAGNAAGDCMQASFREVHWADLDTPLDFAGWWKFVGWALSIAGVRFFSQSRPGMRMPCRLSPLRQLGVRVKLFLLSLFFLILLGTLGLLDLALKRLNIRIKILENAYRLVFDYLGDVKLYQDWFYRNDARAETVGEKSRIAIRRRMVRVLLKTAAETLDDEAVEGFYICAHSLGTVIAFNALMELEHVLPDYLTEEEWRALPDRLKKTVPLPPLPADRERPTRRPWLDPHRGGCAAIDRTVLFGKLRGFITLGSPLDRFAAIWPAIVPINATGVPHPVPWVNVHDVQDPIAGGDLRLFECAASGGDIGGLMQPDNYAWPDSSWFFRAHNSYWNVTKGKERLMDALLRWFEGAPFALTGAGTPWARWRARMLRARYFFTLVSVSLLLLIVFAALVRLGTKIFLALTERYAWTEPLREWLRQHFLVGPYADTVPFIVQCAMLLGVLLIVVCATVRRAWEVAKFGR
jgi:hypothetical protein